MNSKNYTQIILKFIFVITFSIFLQSCEALKFKRSDVKDNPINDADKREKNIREGKGISIGGGKKGSGVFDFATSNEMWRASIELLDFTPLSNVDYSGGIIITDWFSKNNSPKDSMKITIKFLSNEIRADGIKITIHERTCIDVNTCSIKKVESKISEEIKLAILREATLLKENELVKNPDYKDPRIKD